MAEERKERVFEAKICEQAERFEDMVIEMNELVKASSKAEPLTVEERNLLSVAYKNVVGSKRSAWRVISNKIDREQSDKFKQCCNAMKSQVEKELNELCGEILGLLNSKLIPCPENDEAKIFFLKMKGDYYRYMVEICDMSQKEARCELIQTSEDAYKKAMEVAKEKLETTNLIRLGLSLNYSVFQFEINNNPCGASDIARAAFDDAIPTIYDIPEESYNDVSLILQLLRDNLTIWQSQIEEDSDEG